MIDGSSYSKLIAENGKPLSPAEMSVEDGKLQQEIAKRQYETPAQRQQRVGAYSRERRNDNALLDQMIQAIFTSWAKRRWTGGGASFSKAHQPGLPSRQPKHKSPQGHGGKMWIDEQQYQWVKVEAEVFRPVAFGLFIAKRRTIQATMKFTRIMSLRRGTAWHASGVSKFPATYEEPWDRTGSSSRSPSRRRSKCG